MSQLSGIKDVDREILSKLDDLDLLKTCSIDKYTWEKVCDDAFLKRRLLSKYPEIGKYKLETETWKHFFLRDVNYIALMKENFGADIHVENDYALRWASTKGHLETVKYLVESGADIHAYNDAALRLASDYGHLDI
jgi:hypothetical protein